MASIVDVQFSINHDLWSDAWVAGTSAVRARKNKADFNLKQRVEHLLEHYGPQTGKPLTLRVYGTMLKGFCVINNERARLLFTDCERAVILFAQQPSADDVDGTKLPAAKRQRVDALTLNLADLAKAQESAAFDWTQAPLEDGALLKLQSDAQGELVLPLLEQATAQMPCLLEEAALLHESFPALDVPVLGPLDVAPSGATAKTVPPAGSADQWGHALLAPLRRARGQRGLPLPPGPGHVFGFDESTQLPAAEYDGCQFGDGAFTSRRDGPAEFAALMPSRGAQIDHLGALRVLFDPPAQAAHAGAAWGLPGVQTLLADPLSQALPIAEEAPGSVQAGDAGAAEGADPFRPYLPGTPLAAAEGADLELANLLGPGGGAAADADADGGAGRKGRRGKVDEYDSQTAQVRDVLKRFIGLSATEARDITMDDVVPPRSTDKTVAAKTFLSLLTLATAGDFRLGQGTPYGPITISVAR